MDAAGNYRRCIPPVSPALSCFSAFIALNPFFSDRPFSGFLRVSALRCGFFRSALIRVVPGNRFRFSVSPSSDVPITRFQISVISVYQRSGFRFSDHGDFGDPYPSFGIPPHRRSSQIGVGFSACSCGTVWGAAFLQRPGCAARSSSQSWPRRPLSLPACPSCTCPA